MKIDIQNLQSVAKIDKKKVIECVDRVLNAMGEKDAELSLMLVNDMYIRNLNWKYRRSDSATDVLAFPMRDARGLSGFVLGDVVISAETAQREARKRKKDFQEELDLYLIHGILHLLDYTDYEPIPRRRMFKRQNALLRSWERGHP